MPEHPLAASTPASFARRILLAVTGLSPQIVTETVYALGVTPGEGAAPFVPTEIHLLTTESGAQQARTALLHQDGGQFHALVSEYPQLGAPDFPVENIHVIKDEHGNPLSDIRSPQDNAAAADTITRVLSELTSDPGAALHVSIAGGRKTMGFYLGYAFSLFARPQDALSHVLVSEPFENHPEFFFPPAKPRRLATRNGRHIDTAKAVVTLATIPVVHLRHGQPTHLLQGKASFNETVAAIEESLAPPSLQINIGTRTVLCGNRPVKLQPASLTWLALWAQHTLSRMPAKSWHEVDPQSFLKLYARVVGKNSASYENAENRLKNDMPEEFFRENNAKLRGQLKEQLGPAAAPYLLVAPGRRSNSKTSLPIPAHAITLVL